jgi:hypothetical protein
VWREARPRSRSAGWPGSAPARTPGGPASVSCRARPERRRVGMSRRCPGEEAADDGSGQAVTARDRVCVDVQRGRHAGVSQAARHRGQRDQPVEHLGGHEMAEIVQPVMGVAASHRPASSTKGRPETPGHTRETPGQAKGFQWIDWSGRRDSNPRPSPWQGAGPSPLRSGEWPDVVPRPRIRPSSGAESVP